jgi:hypothetical protein
MLVFFYPSCELLPLYHLSDHPPPPHPSTPSQSKRTVPIYRQCVAVGGGVLSSVVGHILHTLYLTRFKTYKIATPSQTKTPVKTTFMDWCLFSSFVLHILGYIG